MVDCARQVDLDLIDRAHARRDDEAQPTRHWLDRPALNEQRHKHDDESDVEIGLAASRLPRIGMMASRMETAPRRPTQATKPVSRCV